MEYKAFMDSKSVRGMAKVILILLAILLLGKSLNEFKNYSGAPENLNNITVEGKGEVLAIPDIATFNFSITEEGKTVPEAQKKATEKNNAVIKMLRDQGIADKDIVSTPSINPKYSYSSAPCSQFACPPSSSVISGYEASFFVSVKVRKAENASTVTAKIGELSVQNLGQVTYTIDNDEELRLEARTKAIADAKQKAKRLAKDLNVDLDEIVSFSENNGGYNPMFMKAERSMDTMAVSGAALPTPDLPMGENKIISTVSVTFRIN
jgi:hypothetical protein